MRTYDVTWTIQVEAESPVEAAEQVWSEQFQRSVANPDDACFFEVREAKKRFLHPTYVDLSEESS